MKKLLAFLVVIAIAVAVLGFYRGWFQLSSGRQTDSNKVDVSLTVDPDRMREDKHSLSDKTSEFTERVKGAAERTEEKVEDAVQP